MTVQLLDGTPAVLSLGKLCEEHGHTNEWASGQKPHLAKNGKRILCKTENFVPLVVPGSSSNSGTSSSSASPPQDSGPATERNDDPAPGNWRDSPKTQKSKEGQQSSLGRDRWRDLPVSCLLWSRDCRQVPAQVRLLHRSRRTHQERLRVQQVDDVTILTNKTRSSQN